jgi:hypothetical protein
VIVIKKDKSKKKFATNANNRGIAKRIAQTSRKKDKRKASKRGSMVEWLR